MVDADSGVGCFDRIDGVGAAAGREVEGEKSVVVDGTLRFVGEDGDVNAGRAFRLWRRLLRGRIPPRRR